MTDATTDDEGLTERTTEKGDSDDEEAKRIDENDEDEAFGDDKDGEEGEGDDVGYDNSDNDDDDDSGGDDDDDDSKQSNGQISLAPRRYPRSKMQMLIDEAEDVNVGAPSLGSKPEYNVDDEVFSDADVDADVDDDNADLFQEEKKDSSFIDAPTNNNNNNNDNASENNYSNDNKKHLSLNLSNLSAARVSGRVYDLEESLTHLNLSHNLLCGTLNLWRSRRVDGWRMKRVRKAIVTAGLTSHHHQLIIYMTNLCNTFKNKSRIK